MELEGFRTHDNKCYKAHMLNLIHDIYNNQEIYQEYLNADIIIIDEGQFFSDLFTFLYNEFKMNTTKHFIVAGLKSDYLMKPIGDMCNIISMADEVEKLYTYCKYCNNKTLFTRLTEKMVSSDMKLVGGEEMYEAVCRNHLKY
jgi:thymidine kinase